MSELISFIRSGRKPVIGMVQVGPLPGSSRYKGGRIDVTLDDALKEAQTLSSNGVDVLMVQNLRDLPVVTKESRGASILTSGPPPATLRRTARLESLSNHRIESMISFAVWL
jgi:hypothetical protein